MPRREALQQYKAKIFEALADPRRIAILELLIAGNAVDLGVISERLHMDKSEALEHLSLLEDRYIVERCQSMDRISFVLINSAISDVMVMMRWYFEQHLTDALALLEKASEGDDDEAALHLREVLNQLREDTKHVHSPVGK